MEITPLNWRWKAKIRFLARILFYAFIGWFILNHNPFGISEKSDQAFQDAFFRLAAPWYDSDAQEDILVILINEESIKNLYDGGFLAANEWPLLYKDHAALFKAIESLSPKALFVDIYFKQERSTDTSYPSLVRTLQKFKDKAFPILFAGGYADEDRSALQRSLSESAQLTINGWQGYGNNYPLQVAGLPTAGHDLYRIACLSDAPLKSCNHENRLGAVSEGEAMIPFWGADSAKPLLPEYTTSSCTANENSTFESARQLLIGLFSGLINYQDTLGVAEQTCAYHPILFADQVIKILKTGSIEQKEKLKALFNNKIIFYGLTLEGLHDEVRTPVHGKLPGVMLHAMALDNLMNYGKNYLHVNNDQSSLWNFASWLLTVIAITFRLFRKESNNPSYNPSTDTQRAVIYLIGFSILVPSSALGFLFFHYEPINILTYFTLVMIMVEMIKSNKINIFLK